MLCIQSSAFNNPLSYRPQFTDKRITADKHQYLFELIAQFKNARANPCNSCKSLMCETCTQ